MSTSLVILAAGIGARYGAGIKQLQSVGPNGELIIDYSIHDAVEAGVNKVIFIIRREIENDFREVIGSRIEAALAKRGVRCEYVFQEPVDFPEGRIKPWGTGQAVLACREVLHEPFCVINADDYYGKEAFVKAYEFLRQPGGDYSYGLVGYILKNTLSDNGGVTRGICTVKDGKLVGIDETKNIIKTQNGAESGGKVLNLESLVSMNFWMFPAAFVSELETGFPEFRRNLKDCLKDEYLLPTIVDGLLQSGKCTVTALSTNDSWFGITYKEDLPTVRAAFQKLYEQGVYPAGNLFEC